MKILLSLPSYHPGYGGPFFSVGALASALTAKGHKVGLMASDFPKLPVQTPPPGVKLFSLPAIQFPLIGGSRVTGGKNRIRHILNEFRPDVVHDNGLWLHQNQVLASLTRSSGIPLIHSPRGCLDSWAMGHHGWKKQVAWVLYQRQDLAAVSCFHAASELEAESIRRMGLKQRIEVVPNGIEFPKAAHGAWGRVQGEEPPGVAQGASAYASLRCDMGGIGQGDFSMHHAPSSMQTVGQKYALYIGRLHPIKNLETVLNAWAKIQPPGWKLKLVGSDEEGYQHKLQSLSGELGISDQVEFHSPVYDDQKWNIIRGASLSFLVSHSENFGLSAAESLGCGVPVIASHTTPWECLQSENMGWWVEGTVAGVSQALSAAIDMKEGDRQQMGCRGSQYVKKTFSWKSVTQQFEHLYQECISKNRSSAMSSISGR